MGIDIGRRVAAEFFGTFWLVFGGCGAAVLAAGFPNLGIAFVAYAPLGRSLLTGNIPDFANLAEGDTRGRHPRFAPQNFAKNRELVQRVEAVEPGQPDEDDFS